MHVFKKNIQHLFFNLFLKVFIYSGSYSIMCYRLTATHGIVMLMMNTLLVLFISWDLLIITNI